MSDHAPEPIHLCRICEKPVIELDGRWWHNTADKDWVKPPTTEDIPKGPHGRRLFRKIRNGKYHHPTCYHAETNYEEVQLTADEFANLDFYRDVCWVCLAGEEYSTMKQEYIWSNNE